MSVSTGFHPIIVSKLLFDDQETKTGKRPPLTCVGLSRARFLSLAYEAVVPGGTSARPRKARTAGGEQARGPAHANSPLGPRTAAARPGTDSSRAKQGKDTFAAGMESTQTALQLLFAHGRHAGSW